MTIRKFKAEVSRVDRYVIEIDDEVMNEAWMDEFSRFMYEFTTLEDHVEHLAQYRARFNNGCSYGGFPEGYGEIALHGKVRQDASYIFPAVNIAEADEDNDTRVEVAEI